MGLPISEKNNTATIPELRRISSMRIHDRLDENFIGPIRPSLSISTNSEPIFNNSNNTSTVSQQTINWYNRQTRSNYQNNPIP